MSAKELYAEIIKNSVFALTHSQEQWAEAISTFVSQKKKDNLFILQGYAGTGKSSMVALLVAALPRIGQRAVLLAPTGRAAKVLSSYARKKPLLYTRKYISVMRRVVNSVLG